MIFLRGPQSEQGVPRSLPTLPHQKLVLARRSRDIPGTLSCDLFQATFSCTVHDFESLQDIFYKAMPFFHCRNHFTTGIV